MFAAYMPWEKQWYMVAGSHMERIAEPPMWFCDDEYAKDHQNDLAKEPRKENPLRIRKQKAEQLLLI